LFCAAVFNEVNACTCLDYRVPTCTLFSRADAVFVGKIERITSAMGDKDASVQLEGVGSISSRGGGPIWVHFTIEHEFKSVAGKTVKALTYSGTSCEGYRPGFRLAGYCFDCRARSPVKQVYLDSPNAISEFAVGNEKHPPPTDVGERK